jgi:hypothetical protein
MTRFLLPETAWRRSAQNVSGIYNLAIASKFALYMLFNERDTLGCGNFIW